MAKNRVRIKDIADRAQVSTGTVDRVLHNRGKVSDEAMERVLKAIDELGYKKNIIASTLAYNKETKIGVLLPNYKTDLYWHDVERGIDAASKKFEHFGVKLKLFLYDLFDPSTFKEALQNCFDFNPAGILFAPQFFDASIDAIEQMHEKDIPVFVINTYLSGKAVVAYIGQDSYQSGVLAGRLLSIKSSKKENNLLIIDISSKADKGKHYIEKVEGFHQFFEGDEHVNIFQKDIENFTDGACFKDEINQSIEHIQPNGIFVTNSRAHFLVDSLDDEHVENITIVGFDLVQPNLDYLKEGKIDFLINQNAFQQGYLGVTNIVNYLVFDVNPKEEQFLPLDIVIPENYRYYTNNSRYFEFVL